MRNGSADGRCGQPHRGIRRLPHDGFIDIIHAAIPDSTSQNSFHYFAPKGGGVCGERALRRDVETASDQLRVI
jgi:hypothetical protein